MKDIRTVSTAIALAVGRQAEQEGLARVRGEDFEQALLESMWEPVYAPYKRRQK